ncbi:DUF1654 domain-containing protein [Azotobacter salinestris]
MSRARVKPSNQPQISSYERLALRIRDAISTPSAQAAQQTVISRRLDESPQDWERLLDEIRDTEGVRVTPQDDGRVRLSWYIEPASQTN